MEQLAITQQKWGIAAGTVALLIIVQLSVRFLKTYVWKPRSIRKAMEAQGVSGPTPSLITGNLLEIEALRAAAWSEPIGKPGEVDHNYVDHLFPHYKLWMEKYGPRFVIWWGEEPAILETDLELIGQVFNSKYDGAYGKYSRYEKTLASVIGMGLPVINGELWFKRRHLIQPAFHAERLKELAPSIISTTTIMLEKWEEAPKGGVEWTRDVAPDLIKVAADIISRTAFKSSYESANGAFEKQLELMKISFESIAWSFIPFYSYIPISRNLRRWKLKSEIEDTLKKLIDVGIRESELDRDKVPTDLMGMLVASNRDPENIASGLGLSKEHLMDEFKTFFAAGFDTISATLTWTMMCLADNPIWQERIYEEIQVVCVDGVVNASSATKLKVLGMVLNETMRLYPPGAQLARTSMKDVQLGKIHIPKGLSVFICVPLIHRQTEVWGADANEFKPERFRDGVANACANPNGYLPFSFGPRSCVAKNFATLEVRLVLAMIVQKFKFTLSPSYLHNPIMEGVVLKAKHGLPVILSRRR